MHERKRGNDLLLGLGQILIDHPGQVEKSLVLHDALLLSLLPPCPLHQVRQIADDSLALTVLVQDQLSLSSCAHLRRLLDDVISTCIVEAALRMPMPETSGVSSTVQSSTGHSIQAACEPSNDATGLAACRPGPTQPQATMQLTL